MPLDRRTFLAGTLTAPLFPYMPEFSPQDADSLLVHTEIPKNAEPKTDQLVKSWITPTDQFYVRSHAPNPKIDPAAFRLDVSGLVERKLSLALGELAGFRQHKVTATLTCAGNRRSEHSRIKPVKGVPWQEGAIGNAEWGGVSLRDILMRAGVAAGARHVWFEGLDQIRKGDRTIPFGASIPLEKAMSTTLGVGALVTTHMNGQPLTPDHGFPVRTVVPGYIGARSVKWLGRIVVSDRPSPNHYVATAYKIVERGDAIEWAEKAPIYRYVLNSVICAQQRVGNRLSVSGYALAHGDAGRTIARVELSVNDGSTWKPAKLRRNQAGSWVLWSAELPLAASSRQIVVRAIDSAGKRQPPQMSWNKKGYLFNAWHRSAIVK